MQRRQEEERDTGAAIGKMTAGWGATGKAAAGCERAAGFRPTALLRNRPSIHEASASGELTLVCVLATARG